MTSMTVAPLLLAGALMMIPDSPRHRLGPMIESKDQGLQSNRVLVRALAAIGSVALVWSLGLAAVIAIALVAATLLRRHARSVARRQTGEHSAELEAALEVLVAELRVGSHPVRAFAVTAADAGPRVSPALGAVAGRALLGADVAAGLRLAGRGLAGCADWERLALFWKLAAENGLSVSVLMRAAQRDLAARQRFTAQLMASMAGARATTAILAGLPVLGVLFGELVGAAPLQFLLGNSVGGWCLMAGSALICVGVLWSDRITEQVLR